MTQFLTFTVVGLSTAAILAVAASGLVVTYQTTGVFNFAHGAVGMVAAFAYWQVRYSWEWPAPIALAVVLLGLAPVMGYAIALLMDGLEGTRDVTRIVVPVSLLVALLGVAVWIWPPEGRFFPPFFDGQKIAVGDIFVTWHQMITILFAAVTAVGLKLIMYGTRAGVTMRAAVDDRGLVQLNSGDPHRSVVLAWVLGTQLAALAGVLAASAIRLSPIGLTLLVVNAYAAAIVGRLRSLPMTFVGALMLGLLDAYAVGYLPTDNDYLAAFRLAIPSLFLFVVLLILPQARLRGHSVQRRREEVRVARLPEVVIGGVLLVVATWVVTGFISQSAQLDVGAALGFGIIALSLVPLVGYAGQISLCQMSFAAVGAIVMAQFGQGGSPGGLVLAVVVSAAIGALVSLPALRLQGLYLALATAAFAVFLDRWVFTLPAVDLLGVRLELFSGGTLRVDRLELPGVSFASARASAVLCAAVFAILAAFVVWVRQGRFGRRLIAIRTSPAAASTLGVRVNRTRFQVFALSAGMAGLGGALLAGVWGGGSSEQFSFVESLVVLLLVVVGGVSLIGGALFAGLSTLGLKVIADLLPSLQQAILLLPGVMGVGLARNPDGVVSQVYASYGPVRSSPPVMAGLFGITLAVAAARAFELLGNGTAVLLLLAAFVFAPPIAKRTRHDHAGPSEGLGENAAGSEPLELAGLRRPWDDDVVAEMNAALGVEA